MLLLSLTIFLCETKFSLQTKIVNYNKWDAEEDMRIQLSSKIGKKENCKNIKQYHCLD